MFYKKIQSLIQYMIFDWLGKTALQLATEKGYKAIADLLNECASIQLNAKDGKKTIYYYLSPYFYIYLLIFSCLIVSILSKQSDPMSPN